MILIVTVEKDLHALEVQRHIRSRATACHIIECDCLAQRDALTFEVNGFGGTSRILTSEGRVVAVSDATVLWFRRTSGSQRLRWQVDDERAASIMNHDCRSALAAMLTTQFAGTWISKPDATYAASDKVAQLSVARACGWRVPRTLVTQSRDAVIEFVRECEGKVVAKTVAGAQGAFLETVLLEDPDAYDRETYAAAPAIYQEYIPGEQHLRLNCFGDQSYAALIDTGDLDWRGNLNVPIYRCEVEPGLHRDVRRVLDTMDLAMGIVDLKLTPEGEPVWLEVNPQGQFLFLDALANLGLAERLADYLVEVHTGEAPRVPTPTRVLPE